MTDRTMSNMVQQPNHLAGCIFRYGAVSNVSTSCTCPHKDDPEYVETGSYAESVLAELEKDND
jgi:hypothetical protein